MKRLVVSANCLTGSLSASLKTILKDEFEILPIPCPAANDEAGSNFIQDALSDCDYWITSGLHHLSTNKKTTIIKYKNIEFDFFFPDLTYVKNINTGQLTNFHANSRIAVWAYNKSMSADDSLKLFCKESYKALGYFNYWDNAYESLRSGILECGFSEKEFYHFYLRIKRNGLFMHTINHPRANVVAELAKLYAKKIRNDLKFEDVDILIHDTLLGDVWPIYPEIGNEIGMPGSYYWRIFNNDIFGIKNYLDFSYDSYAEQAIKPGDLELISPPSLSLNAPINYDIILSNLWNKI